MQANVFAVGNSNTMVEQAMINARYSNNAIIITNQTSKAINLNNAVVRFNYMGTVFSADSATLAKAKFKIESYNSPTVKNARFYNLIITNTNNILKPKQTLRINLKTDKHDIPNHIVLLGVPTPVNVKVSVANANWVETISICNTTNQPIPLSNLEFDFNYSSKMPSNIWGTPWAAWKLVSQNGSQVVLTGGTPFTPALSPDPFCMSPLTIQFNASPDLPAPVGPFVFKADTGTQPTTGSLNVSLAAAPAPGLPNPVIAVSGNTSAQQTVAWGMVWKLTSLMPGTYTVTGFAVSSGQQQYTADPVTVTVSANNTATATVIYKASTNPTGKVTINLVTPPSASVPVTFTGTKSTINQTVTNNAVLTLPADTYSVTSNVPGYTANPVPNPLVVPNNTNLTITYTATGGGSGFRTITMVNRCPFPVWFGFISGATPNHGGTCNSDADCDPGSTCVNRGAGGNQCFWKTPVPADNNFRLEANGGTNSVKLPFFPGLNAFYSGAAAGRTNCTAAGCETADCGAGTGGCPAGRGFMQPATQAEFTFGVNSPDFYDVEVINGMNLPVEMAANTADRANPYDCGRMGSTTANGSMGACTWDMVPPSVDYNWVRAGGNACNSNADCAGGTFCGLSFNPGKNPLLQKTCGTRLGYWTANQVCGIVPNYGAPFNCQKQWGLTLSNLYGCTQVGSCYQQGADTKCCGCANWDKVGTGVPPGPITAQCVNSNPVWVSDVLPTLLWIKKAAPSVYTYPYDDMSSTAICTIMKDNGGKQINSADYTITFCPGGKTGGVQN